MADRARGRGMMDASAGTLVRIYRMADKQAQMLVAGLLNGMHGVAAHHRDRNGSTCLVVTCASIAHANSADRIVKHVDPASVLVQTTNRPDEPVPLVG